MHIAVVQFAFWLPLRVLEFLVQKVWPKDSFPPFCRGLSFVYGRKRLGPLFAKNMSCIEGKPLKF